MLTATDYHAALREINPDLAMDFAGMDDEEANDYVAELIENPQTDLGVAMLLAEMNNA